MISHIDLQIRQEFSRRVAQSAPVSQIASVLLSFTQRRPLSSKQKELARQLVEQAAPKLDDSIKILVCRFVYIDSLK